MDFFPRKKWSSYREISQEETNEEEMEFFKRNFSGRNVILTKQDEVPALPALPTLCISKVSSHYPNFPARNDRDMRSVTKLSTRNAENARKVRGMWGQFWNATIRNIDFCEQGHPIIYSKNSFQLAVIFSRLE